MVCFILHVTVTKSQAFSSSPLLFPSSREHRTHVSKKHNGKCKQETSKVSVQHKAYFSSLAASTERFPEATSTLKVSWPEAWLSPHLLSLVSPLCWGCLQIPSVLRRVSSGPSLPAQSWQMGCMELGTEFSLQIPTYTNPWGGDIFWCMEHSRNFDLSLSAKKSQSWCLGHANTCSGSQSVWA